MSSATPPAGTGTCWLCVWATAPGEDCAGAGGGAGATTCGGEGASPARAEGPIPREGTGAGGGLRRGGRRGGGDDLRRVGRVARLAVGVDHAEVHGRRDAREAEHRRERDRAGGGVQRVGALARHGDRGGGGATGVEQA